MNSVHVQKIVEFESRPIDARLIGPGPTLKFWVICVSGAESLQVKNGSENGSYINA